MLKTSVKASSISNLTDARYYAAWCVDWLGFDLRAGAKTLSLAEVKAIKEWVEGPVIVGEIDLFDFEEAKEIIAFLDLGAIQVGMFTPVEYLQSLQDYSIIKEVVIEPTMTLQDIQAHLASYFEVVDYFLLDFERNGINWQTLREGTIFPTKALQELCQRQQIFLSISGTAMDIEEMLATIQPYGLSIKGEEEEKVGFKSFEAIDEIFERLTEE